MPQRNKARRGRMIGFMENDERREQPRTADSSQQTAIGGRELVSARIPQRCSIGPRRLFGVSDSGVRR
jgi:hypothetical protein